MIGVTVTGADDEVDFESLSEMSQEFPFVEWGILMSSKRIGTSRYPSASWMLAAAQEPGIRLSLHVCGRLSRELILGSGAVVFNLPAAFRRLQVNGYQPGLYGGLFGLSQMHIVQTDFILQARSEDSLQQVADDVARIPGASVLFDASGGRGLEPFGWPTAPANTKMGFAGGIGPENVRRVIGEIIARNPTIGDFWIDMESGVRDLCDHFDLRRVREVLEQVALINGEVRDAT